MPSASKRVQLLRVTGFGKAKKCCMISLVVLNELKTVANKGIKIRIEPAIKSTYFQKVLLYKIRDFPINLFKDILPAAYGFMAKLNA